MTIYSPTGHRKIYEQHFGPIPKDSNGRSYEIHHIDGNHSNNDPSNLKCVTIQEHYDIHHSQGDWAACLLIANRMNLTYEERCRIAKLAAKTRTENGTNPFCGPELNRKRVENGTHNFLGPETNRKRIEAGTHPWLDKDAARERELAKVQDGSHRFLGGEIQSKTAKKRVNEGTHPFLGGQVAKRTMQQRLASGTSPSQIKKTCEHCGKNISLPMYSRWHGDKCKNRG